MRYLFCFLTLACAPVDDSTATIGLSLDAYELGECVEVVNLRLCGDARTAECEQGPVDPGETDDQPVYECIDPASGIECVQACVVLDHVGK